MGWKVLSDRYPVDWEGMAKYGGRSNSTVIDLVEKRPGSHKALPWS